MQREQAWLQAALAGSRGLHFLVSQSGSAKLSSLIPCLSFHIASVGECAVTTATSLNKQVHRGWTLEKPDTKSGPFCEMVFLGMQAGGVTKGASNPSMCVLDMDQSRPGKTIQVSFYFKGVNCLCEASRIQEISPGGRLDLLYRDQGKMLLCVAQPLSPPFLSPGGVS